MKERFSKAALELYLIEGIEYLRGFYGFDPDNGSAQVAGHSHERILAYGRYAALKAMLSDLRGGYITGPKS